MMTHFKRMGVGIVAAGMYEGVATNLERAGATMVSASMTTLPSPDPIMDILNLLQKQKT